MSEKEKTREPFEFDKCTVTLVLQLLPDDKDEQGRKVIMSVHSHGDPPDMEMVRLNALAKLPAPIEKLVDTYGCEKCTVNLVLQLLPHDGDEQGRKVILGILAHDSEGNMGTVRMNELGQLPEPITSLLDAFAGKMPERQIQWMKDQENKKPKRKTRTTVKTTSPEKADEKPAEAKAQAQLSMFG